MISFNEVACVSSTRLGFRSIASEVVIEASRLGIDVVGVPYRRSACSAWAPGVRARRRVRGVVPAWRRIPRRRRPSLSVSERQCAGRRHTPPSPLL